jgi:hypothetical protein
MNGRLKPMKEKEREHGSEWLKPMREKKKEGKASNETSLCKKNRSPGKRPYHAFS